MENEKKERLYVRIEQRLFWFIIGALFNKMAPVLWVIAVLGTITVAGRMMYTWRQLKPIDEKSMADQREASRQGRQSKLSNAVATGKS